MLKIHNSLTGLKQEFVPLVAGEVRMYVCGITVYDHIHIGHARMLTVFDLVQRYLRSLGLRVTYVRNITDIDDKIIDRAAKNGENWADLARRFTDSMHADCAALGLQPPDQEPRATDFLGEIVASPDIVQLTMLRAELGCAVSGSASAASVNGNGNRVPPI